MRMQSRLFSLSVLMAVAAALPALAQEAPSFEITGGLSYARLTRTNWTGWDVSGAKSIGPVLGIAFDVERIHHSENVELGALQSYTSGDRTFLFMAGPRVASRGPRKLTPYANVLLGVAHGSYVIVNTFNDQTVSVSDTSTNFCMLLGGGMDYQWKGPLSVRIVQIDYLCVHIPSTVTFSSWVKGWKFSAGLTLQLGKVTY
jgi:hypothetical protein